jgi:hypothetical protein
MKFVWQIMNIPSNCTLSDSLSQQLHTTAKHTYNAMQGAEYFVWL